MNMSRIARVQLPVDSRDRASHYPRIVLLETVSKSQGGNGGSDDDEDAGEQRSLIR